MVAYSNRPPVLPVFCRIVLCCPCFAVPSLWYLCPLCRLTVLSTYIQCLFYEAYGSPYCLQGLQCLHTFYAGLQLHPTWIDSRPDMSLACQKCSLAPGLLSYISQVPCLFTCPWYLPYAQSMLHHLQCPMVTWYHLLCRVYGNQYHD